MNTGDVYMVGLISFIANGIFTFRIMKVLEETNHPNLYALPIFVSLGLLLFFSALIIVSIIKGDKLMGGDGVLVRLSSDISLTSALASAGAAGLSGYGLPATASSMISFMVFTVVYFIVKSILR